MKITACILCVLKCKYFTCDTQKKNIKEVRNRQQQFVMEVTQRKVRDCIKVIKGGQIGGQSSRFFSS